MGATASIALGTGFSIYQQKQQERATSRQAAYEADIYGLNADLADRQAGDAIVRGREAESRFRTGTRQQAGAARASLAAQGLALDVGSAADAVGDIEALGELDALTIRNNARREAWGFQTEAAEYRSRAKMTRVAGANSAAAQRSAAGGTLLTGALSTYGMYRRGH
jgi:hypothetical protein